MFAIVHIFCSSLSPVVQFLNWNYVDPLLVHAWFSFVVPLQPVIFHLMENTISAKLLPSKQNQAVLCHAVFQSSSHCTRHQQFFYCITSASSSSHLNLITIYSDWEVALWINPCKIFSLSIQTLWWNSEFWCRGVEV